MARNLGVSCTNEKPYYFISYNSEDEMRVTEYAKGLLKFCVPVWYDNGLRYGGDWEEKIVDKIQHCEAVIMFISKSIFSKEHSYVHKEFELATKHFNKTIYIIMLDDIRNSDVPNKFKMWWTDVTRLHCVTAYDGEIPEKCIQKFLENIEYKEKDKDADFSSKYVGVRKTAHALIVEFLKNKPNGASSKDIVEYCLKNDIKSQADNKYKSIHGSLSKMKKNGEIVQTPDGKYFLLLREVKNEHDNFVTNVIKTETKNIIGKKVFHKAWGYGVVVEYNNNHIFVDFGNFSKTFLPNAIGNFLVIVDDAFQDRVINNTYMVQNEFVHQKKNVEDNTIYRMEYFIEWISHRYNISYASSRRYKSALIRISEIMLELEICPILLYEITDEHTISTAIKKIFDRKEFEVIDQKAHRMYSLSLNRYCEFVVNTSL